MASSARFANTAPRRPVASTGEPVLIEFTKRSEREGFMQLGRTTDKSYFKQRLTNGNSATIHITAKLGNKSLTGDRSSDGMSVFKVAPFG
jgi:hypothetical protein